MTRLGSYWLLFVIVAVGLSLSWQQLGRKTDRLLRSDPVVYLVNDSDCRPGVAPCAAFARDRALVLGPAGQGLTLKQTGLEPADLIDGEVVFLDANDRQVGRRGLSLDGRPWQLAGIPAAAQSLRVRLTGNREVTVGEFPLK